MANCRNCFLITIRLLQATCALIIIAFGSWIVHVIHSIDKDVDVLVDDISAFSEHTKETIKGYVDSIFSTPKRVSFSIVAGVWIVCAVIFITVYRRYAKKTSKAVLVGVELLTFLFTFGAFIAIVSLTVEIEPACLLIDTVPALVAVVKVCPASKGDTAIIVFGVVLSLVTLIILLVQECCDGRRKKDGAIAMEHGLPTYTGYQYQTVAPVAGPQLPTKSGQVYQSVAQVGEVPPSNVSSHV